MNLVPGYTANLNQYKRRSTLEVKIGDIALGAENPIRVQSMTTTDTMDTAGSVAQIIRMVEAGCEYVRLTAPSIKEAENLANIKKELHNRGIRVPLIADIHYTPNAAEMAARIVEKVRINPGNYADKKKFEVIDYTDAAYQAELERIREKFLPLLRICKEYGTAMRIGTNHGSLSDRILSRYGDTPKGMVESAMEFLRICRDENYHSIVLSMKASNPQVMIQAYRLLVQQIDALGWNYPLHVGVTEAGDGEDGRVKSAVGIGTLLEDGIGDTIRVSLTEDPEFEIPVARALVDRYKTRAAHAPIPAPKGTLAATDHNPYSYTRRTTSEVFNLGAGNVPRVIADLSAQKVLTEFELKQLGYLYDPASDKWNSTDQACDFIYRGSHPTAFMLPNGLRAIHDADYWAQEGAHEHAFPLFSAENFGVLPLHPTLNFIRVAAESADFSFFEKINRQPSVVLWLYTLNEHAMPALRQAFAHALMTGCTAPVIVERHYPNTDKDRLQLFAATDQGGLFTDGFGDGLMLSAENTPPQLTNNLAFGILQATRMRISRTEYISCPSCGRTLFDLQETTARIRKETDHLKGVKIGIMGCIVNGPGEMADADYGYVGTGPGKITLYKGKEVIKRNVPESEAVRELIEIIRTDGNWVEKTPLQAN